MSDHGFRIYFICTLDWRQLFWPQSFWFRQFTSRPLGHGGLNCLERSAIAAYTYSPSLNEAVCLCICRSYSDVIVSSFIAVYPMYTIDSKGVLFPCVHCVQRHVHWNCVMWLQYYTNSVPNRPRAQAKYGKPLFIVTRSVSEFPTAKTCTVYGRMSIIIGVLSRYTYRP